MWNIVEHVAKKKNNELRCLLTRRMTRSPCFLEIKAPASRQAELDATEYPCNIDAVIDVEGKKSIPGISVTPVQMQTWKHKWIDALPH